MRELRGLQPLPAWQACKCAELRGARSPGQHGRVEKRNLRPGKLQPMRGRNLPAWQGEILQPDGGGKARTRPCPHGKLKHNWRSLQCKVWCEHGKLKYVCVACTSVRAERPNARVSRS